MRSRFSRLTVSRRGQADVEVAIGECKTNFEISEQDIANLCNVAESLAHHGFHAFVILSKTGTFSDGEIVRCKQAKIWDHGGIILLSRRELEPYSVYERVNKEFQTHEEAGEEVLGQVAILEALVELLTHGQREPGDFAVASHRGPPERGIVCMRCNGSQNASRCETYRRFLNRF